jgi:acyl-CoA synthetase (AMP-forming)/AMP-acid ligase II
VTLIPDQLRNTAARYPDEIGFTVAGVGDLTLGAWHTESSRFARGLVHLGVRAGDRVALVTAPEDALRFVVAYAAIHKAGAVAVPVNIRMSPSEVAGVLRHCEPAAVVVSPELRHLLGQAVDVTGPGGARLVSTAKDDDPSYLPWDEVLTGDDSDLQVPRDTDDLAEILYTSGTTGLPKGVAIRHSNSALVLLTDQVWTGKVWLHASPMFTMAGLTFVYQPMRMGMRTLYLPRFSSGGWIELADEFRPCGCFLVPSMVELLLADDRFQSTDLGSLDIVSVGAAPIAPSTLLRLEERVPDALVTNSYSMTEAGTAYFVMPKGELAHHPGSVGLPLPPAKVRVVDDDGNELPTREVGNVHVRPAGRMREYYKAPEASAEVFASDGWLRTGDLGWFDETGYLYIAGRAKDMIIRGGYNIYATDVEAALYEHPAVLEAAVVGVPHQVLGEDIAAFVVLRDGGAASAEELTDFCRERLADYKVPRCITFAEALPRNATGKVLKRELVPKVPLG